MAIGPISLTDKEQELFDKIISSDWTSEIGEAMLELVTELADREAIPEPRYNYFFAPDYNVGGRGKSRYDVFEHNTTRGNAVFSHPHFVKYLKYFILGVSLPLEIQKSFLDAVQQCGGYPTSGDIPTLCGQAKVLAKKSTLPKKERAEEFYKLALDCDLDQSDSATIRKVIQMFKG